MLQQIKPNLTVISSNAPKAANEETAKKSNFQLVKLLREYASLSKAERKAVKNAILSGGLK